MPYFGRSRKGIAGVMHRQITQKITRKNRLMAFRSNQQASTELENGQTKTPFLSAGLLSPQAVQGVVAQWLP
jgi:hypothetical protein